MFYSLKPISHKTKILVALLSFSGLAAANEAPNLGKPLTDAEVKSIDITMFPDGSNLPEGQGSVAAGKALYDSQCAACHGANGEGAGWIPKLADKEHQGPHWSTGGSFPYATSIFDYINRAMPPMNVKQLSATDVYSVTAYILYLNGLITKEQSMNSETLPLVKMPAAEKLQIKWFETEQLLFKKEVEMR